MKMINYCSVVSKMSGVVKDKQLNKGNPSIYLGVISFYKMYWLQKNLSFPLRISSVNVTKTAGNCGFGHIYWKNP